MLDENRLKEKFKAAFEAEQTEQEDYNASLDRVCAKMAKAVVEEIKETKITYTVGLIAPSGGGPVTGEFTYTIT